MSATLAPPGGTDLDQRLGALADAVRLAAGRLEPDLVAAAEAIVLRADARLRVGTDHTVVALAGATGSGKSSLFNAVAGRPLSTVGVRRPTTGGRLVLPRDADAGGEAFDGRRASL